MATHVSLDHLELACHWDCWCIQAAHREVWDSHKACSWPLQECRTKRLVVCWIQDENLLLGLLHVFHSWILEKISWLLLQCGVLCISGHHPDHHTLSQGVKTMLRETQDEHLVSSIFGGQDVCISISRENSKFFGSVEYWFTDIFCPHQRDGNFERGSWKFLKSLS